MRSKFAATWHSIRWRPRSEDQKGWVRWLKASRLASLADRVPLRPDKARGKVTRCHRRSVRLDDRIVDVSIPGRESMGLPTEFDAQRRQ